MTRPQYWRGYAEREASPEFQVALESEFGEEASPSTLGEPTRRGFLGLVSAALAGGSLAGCVRRPEQRIMPYSKAPEDLLPGVPQRYATATHLAGEVIGLLVESHEGRPTKLEGNPDHPTSGGGTNALQQGWIFDLYDPTRLTTPLKGHKPATLDEAAAFIKAQIIEAKGGVAVLSEAAPSPSLMAMRARLEAKGVRWITYEPINRDAEAEGLQAALKARLIARPRVGAARVILSLDADFLGVEGTVAQTRDWAASRRALKSRLYVVEGRYSLTGTNADHRLRLRSDAVEGYAWALASALGVDDPEIKAAAPKPALSVAAQANLKAVAADLKAGGGLVLAGRRQPPVVHALVAHINQALKAPVDYFPAAAPVNEPLNGAAALAGLVKAIKAGEIEALVILGGDPARTAPADLKLGEALGQLKTLVHLADRPCATARLAHLTIPRSHFLEAWSDWVSAEGVVSIQQPLVAPLHASWSAHTLLAHLLGDEEKGCHAIVRGHYRALRGALGFHRAWRKWLHDGLMPERAFEASPAVASGLGGLKASTPIEGPLVEFVEDPHLFDGRFEHNVLLQEAPDPVTKLTWDNAALMSPKTAKALGVIAEQRVSLKVGEALVHLPAWIVPGMADESVFVALGYGAALKNAVEYAQQSQVGVDVYPLRATAGASWAAVKIEPLDEAYPLACVQRYARLDPGYDYPERHNVREATLAEYQANPTFAKPGIIKHGEPIPKGEVIHPPEASIFGDHDYSKGNQWGMVIDLNACTGCNACLMACVAENNIPAVGKAEVMKGRELHWIRMDRYFVGDEEDPQVVHQPMACQQCETAPCENVCPVAATTHSPEGLNDMAYNRCIGTRYCSNNCPFKVRRFNFYNYAKDQAELAQMQRNPNVTVRFRGVMEKCTYCVQRINAGKRLARDAADPRAIIESITPACGQACPAGAIVFGDINDKNSRVSALKQQPLDYTLLSSLNLQPRTSYLAKVRNPNPKLEG